MIDIIVVEDQPIIHDGIRVLLNTIEDFNVIATYSNGKEFIRNIKNTLADVVLMDIDMPIMNGIKATKHAVSLHSNLKIIALSMYSNNKYYFEMITAGAKGFVLKQSNSKELEKAIREVYEGKNYFSRELLHSVVLNMNNLEEQIKNEKKEILSLSERDIDLLGYICQGFTNKEIADSMFVSIKTVESNKAKLMKKTNTKNNAGLIIWSIKNKIIEV